MIYLDLSNINTNRDTTSLGPIEYDQTKVPAYIRKHANYVRTKTWGQDVREAQARNAEYAGLVANQAVSISNETSGRQSGLESTFDSLQQEITNKDVISAPEIIAARGGSPQLKDRLDATDARLEQVVRLAPINNEDVANSIRVFYETLEDGVTLKVPAGEYTLNEPLVFDRNIDLDCSGVTFRYSGIGTAITVGIETVGSTGLHGRTYVMPNVFRNTLNWNDDVNGIRVVNINASRIHFNTVSKFRKGIIIDGQGYGNSYNDYHLKSITNNLLSIVLTSNTTGWSNENTFYGGRFGLTSDTSSAVTEENTHVLIEDNGYSQNNNVFFRSSFESGAKKGVEHVAKIENGRMIYFRDCRYESVYNVDITTGTDIQFTNGFGINDLKFKDKMPHIFESADRKVSSKWLGFEYDSSVSANNDIANYYSGGLATPRFTIKGNGDLYSRGSIKARYGFQWGTGAYPQTFLNGNDSPMGKVESTAGSVYIKNQGGQIYIKTYGNDASGWVQIQRITSSTTSNRPNGDVVGTMHFDTTLKKPLWWTGENWVDATGSVV